MEKYITKKPKLARFSKFLLNKYKGNFHWLLPAARADILAGAVACRAVVAVDAAVVGVEGGGAAYRPARGSGPDPPG